MKHALSTHLFVNHRLTTASLERILHAGVELAEIFCARQHFDYTNRAQVMELSHWFKDSDLTLHSLHSPIYTDDVWGRSGPHSVITITESVKAKRVQMVDEIRRAIEVAEYVPFKYLVQHVGVSGEEYSERAVDAAFSSLEELSVFGRQRGVEILLENIPNALSSAERLVQFLAQTHLHLGFCFDVGHAHMGEGIEVAFDIMRDRIRSTHVHDNNGVEDKHIWPIVGEGGTIDWSHAMQVLRSRGDQYPLMLELKEVPDRKHQIDDVPEIFDRLESL
jgi:sugar phosphate isomerase/epimerase